MQYKLENGCSSGILIDQTPILRDIKDTFEVSFVLPCEGAYVALFRDAEGIEYRATLRNGTVKLPKQLLSKEQIVGLTVCKIECDAITQSWECHPLKVGTFLSLRKTQWQITAGLDDTQLYKQLSELEYTHAQTLSAVDALRADYTSCAEQTAALVKCVAERLDAVCDTLVSQKSANEALAIAHNQAVKIINDLSERVALLEKNFDPTLIK